MFAVIRTGGKQYKVAKDDVIKIEKLSRGSGAKPCEPGEMLVFDEVLAAGDGESVKLGNPLVAGVKVSGEVLAQKKDDKVIIFKKKRRHNYRRKRGHRQELVWVKIREIGEQLKDSQAAKPSAKAGAAAGQDADKEAAAAGSVKKRGAGKEAAAAGKPKKSSKKEA